MWVPTGIPVSTHEDPSLEMPVGTHWPMGFWLADPGDPWERIFPDLGVTFGAQIPMGMDLGHLWVHSCPALLAIKKPVEPWFQPIRASPYYVSQ